MKIIAVVFWFVSGAWTNILAQTDSHVVEVPVSKDFVNRQYYLGPRDILEITVMGLKEFERKGLGDELEFVVNENGFVNVPLIGLVMARGETTSKLTNSLTERFKKYVTQPQVSVVIKRYRSKLVHVLGKVYNNGAIALKYDNTTLFEVLAEAGGFSSKLPSLDGIALNQPDMRNVYVIRNNKKYVINIYDRLIDQADDEPFLMKSGDKIFVPEPVQTISVLGGVKKAGSFELKNGLSLLQAIAMAGSFVEDSRRDQVQIIRKGLKVPMTVNAVRIVKGRAEDIKLKSGDVVYVAEW
tara:strand:+ start:354 stop:1244 length:891 start_codon:yes stop_codon:yes gene_type:complete